MSCCRQCEGLETMFNSKIAQDDLEAYRRQGARGTTRLLLNELRAIGVAGQSLLDIGGGVGILQHELVKSGVSTTTDVDASSAYLAAAKDEASRLGYVDRANYLFGNFVALAPNIEAADIVTLDRVVCCFPDMHNMVRLSAMRARHLYGLVYPQYAWWNRVGQRIASAALALVRNKYRFYIHPSREVESLIESQGLRQRFHRNVGLIWQVAVYERS